MNLYYTFQPYFRPWGCHQISPKLEFQISIYVICIAMISSFPRSNVGNRYSFESNKYNVGLSCYLMR